MRRCVHWGHRGRKKVSEINRKLLYPHPLTPLLPNSGRSRRRSWGSEGWVKVRVVKASMKVGNGETPWAPPVGSGAEPRPKTDFSAFQASQNASRRDVCRKLRGPFPEREASCRRAEAPSPAWGFSWGRYKTGNGCVTYWFYQLALGLFSNFYPFLT